MGLVGIGAVLALLLAFLMLLAKARHDRVVRLIHQTPGLFWDFSGWRR